MPALAQTGGQRLGNSHEAGTCPQLLKALELKVPSDAMFVGSCQANRFIAYYVRNSGIAVIFLTADLIPVTFYRSAAE